MPGVGSDAGIDARGLDVGVTEERRDLLEGSHLVQHGGGSRVAEPVGGDVDTRFSGGCLHPLGEGIGVDGLTVLEAHDEISGACYFTLMGVEYLKGLEQSR